MPNFAKLLDLENSVFRGYLTYGSILVVKTMLMAPLTTNQRSKHGILASPEDGTMLKTWKFGKSSEDVDRVRRAHLNDLENIPIFFFAGFAYLLTDPNEGTALNLFRAVALARCIHTLVYAVYVVPQPARGIAWVVAYACTGYMAIKAICHFATF